MPDSEPPAPRRRTRHGLLVPRRVALSTPSRWQALRRVLPRNVLLMGLASLGNDLASEMILPLLPAFLTLTLGAGPALVGLIDGVADGMSAVLKLYVGRLTDRSGRRRQWVIAGYLLSSLARPAIGLATAPLHVLGVRILDRVGKGMRTSPRDALLAASVAPEHLATSFGLHRAMDHAGAVLGGLVGAGLVAAGWPVQDVFIAALVPGLLPSMILLALREVRTPPAGATTASGASGASASSASSSSSASSASSSSSTRIPGRPPGTAREGLDARFGWLVAATGLAALGTVGEGLLLLRAQTLGVALAALPLLWAALHVVKSVVSAAAGPYADRIGRARLLALGWAGQAALYGLLTQVVSLDAFVLLFLAWGARIGLTEGAEKALVAGFSPASRRGTAFGWFHSVTGLAMMASGALIGGLWQTAGAPVAMAAAALLSLGALALLTRAVR